MSSNAYHRVYQAKRFVERMALAKERLGGKCVVCGTLEDLEFDHIDERTKVANVSEIANWSLVKFLSEVDKCQLLCRTCHIRKPKQPKNEHGGGRQGIAGCKCEKCITKRRETKWETKKLRQHGS